MSRLSIVVAVVLLFGFVGQVKSEDLRHEVVLTGISGDFTFGSGDTTIGVGGNYQYTVVPNTLQLGLQAVVSYVEVGAESITLASVLVGPTLNFPMTDMLNAFFLSGALGFTHASISGTSATKFTFGFELGKRFQILEHFSYRPSVAIVKVSGASARFSLSLLSFALLL